MAIIILMLLLSISWGDVVTLGYAEQSHAPAILPYKQSVLSAWIDVEDNETFHVLHLGKRAYVPPLLPVHPYNQTLYAAHDDFVHILWIDAPFDEPDADNRLWVALIGSDLSIELGPNAASHLRTEHYTTISNDDYSLTIVWSGGGIAEPALYIQYVDPVGRPQPAKQLTLGGNWPILVKSEENLHLFWISEIDNYLYRGIINENRELDTITRLTNNIHLNLTDRLSNVYAGIDSSGQAYFVWTIIDANGGVHTWIASGHLDDSEWNSPSELEDIGWNSAAQGDTNNEFVMAAQVEDELVLLYFYGGTLINSDPVLTLETPLIGPPNLYKQTDQYYLAWSEPASLNQANLKIVQSES